MKYIVVLIIVLGISVGGYFLLAPAEVGIQENISNTTASSNTSFDEGEFEGEGNTKEETIVTYTSDGFSPEVITVVVGSEIIFINDSEDEMWVEIGSHDNHTDASDHPYGPGESFTYTTNEVGKFEYHNHLSAADTGTIIVE